MKILKKFRYVLQLLFPISISEWVVLLFFLAFYGVLGTVIALDYRIIYDERIPWDAYFSFDNRSIVLTGGGFERHPLSNYFFNWIREFALLISDGKRDATFRLVLACFSNIAISLGILQVFKYLKNIVKLPLFINGTILLFYSLFSTNILLSFTPETYTYSLLFLVLYQHYAVEKLNKNQNIPPTSITLAGVFIGGLTITNIVKIYIPLLFEQNTFKKTRNFLQFLAKSAISVVVFIVLYLFRLDFNYLKIFEKTGEQYEKFSHPKVTPLWDMVASWFLGGNVLFSNFVIRDYHNKKGFQYKALFMDVYSSCIPYIFIAVLLGLIFWSYCKNFKNKYVQILMISFFVDVIIHAGLRFGLHTSYIYGGHFVFVFPLLLGWLFHQYKNAPKTLTFIWISVFLLLLYLGFNNYFRMQEFFFFLNQYYL